LNFEQSLVENKPNHFLDLDLWLNFEWFNSFRLKQSEENNQMVNCNLILDTKMNSFKRTHIF